jgi:hypothetical protein
MTSKPIAATPVRRLAAVRSVPDFQVPSRAFFAPSERGKNSYQAPTAAAARSTRSGAGSLSVSSEISGASAIADARRASCATFMRAAGVSLRSRRAARACVKRAEADRPRISAPIAKTSSTSWPASILMSALCSQDAQSSAAARMRKLHMPARVTGTSARQRSVPAPTSRIR